MADEKKKSEEVKAPAVGGFDDEVAPSLQKKGPEKVVARKVRADEDYRHGFNPARSLGHVDPTDPEGKKMLPQRKGGFVNQAGILFPEGMILKGGHVAWDGRVYLNKCPRCGHRNSPDRAQSGACSNLKANEGNGCGFSLIDELEAIVKA